MGRDSTPFKLEFAFGCLIALLVGVGSLGLSRHFPISESMVLAAIGLAVCIAVFTTRRLKREMKERGSAQDTVNGLSENLDRKVAERTEELKRSAEGLRFAV